MATEMNAMAASTALGQDLSPPRRSSGLCLIRWSWLLRPFPDEEWLHLSRMH